MKSFIFKFIFLLLIVLTILIFFLSTKGYETDKFNKIILNQVEKNYENFDIKLKKIKIKIDTAKFQIFLSTKNPKVSYYKNNLPIKSAKIYIDFFSLIKSEFSIRKVEINTGNLDYINLKKIFLRIKPSNFKSFILNNLSNGFFKSNLVLFFDQNSKVVNFKIIGEADNIKVNFKDKFKIKNTNFSFSFKDGLVSLKNINGEINDIDIKEGFINIKTKNDININGSLTSRLNLNQDKLKRIFSSLRKNKFLSNKLNVSGEFINEFQIFFDKTLKVKNYNYDIKGKVDTSKIKFNKSLESTFLEEPINQIEIIKTDLIYNSSKDKPRELLIQGDYRINENDLNKYQFNMTSNKENSIYKIDLDFKDFIKFDLINYKKNKNVNSKIKIDINNNKGAISVNKFIYSNNKKDLIDIKNIKFDKKLLIKSFKSIKIVTFDKEKENNNFEILFGKSIKIKGKKFDGTNLMNFIEKNSKNNPLKNLNKNISINLENIETKMKNKITNFNLIGSINKGKFTKINSKGEFGNNKYIDISLQIDKKTKKKHLEIFSDLTKPLLHNYDFFKNLEGGKLLLLSKYDESLNDTSITIDDFKVKNAPGFIKLLSLADFGGMADLLKKEGLSFDKLEIKFTKNKSVLKLHELYAVGPSVSVLMEGYIENKSGLVSLKGTMVPAKDLNNLISKIPVIGDILIPKEIGEGLFGVSFKLKGLPGKVKTTVNPLKTITPRFITRALEKKKKN